MESHRESDRSSVTRLAVIAGSIVLLAAGVVAADTLTRPLDVQLRTHIEVYQESERGEWKKVDEVGPTSVRFDANLLEMARGEKIGTDYALRTRSKAGKEYGVRLAEDADISLNPATGRFEADLVFLVEYDGKRARVQARPTTDTRFGPRGAMRGKRAEGVLGRGPTTLTLVSVNELALDDERPMMLVTEETYRMIPRGEGRSGR